MSKARTLADFISDGSEFADGTISVAEVSGAAPLASPTFTGHLNADDITMSGYLTVNGSGVDINTLIYPNGISMADSRAISFGTDADFELWGGSTFMNLNLKDPARHFRFMDGLTELHRFSGDGSVVLNYDGLDADFRVESNNNTHALFVDAGNDRVGIANPTPSSTLHVSGNVTADSFTNVDLISISKVITDTAVDIFVYDTRKDSDGGAWRKRTQHTSWYNETLNTATRGSRKEFPAVAVIVAESNQVTIYDGDDPDLPMWMVFNEANQWSALGWINDNTTSISMVNGDLFIGRGGDSGVTTTGSEINMIRDTVYLWRKTYGSINTNGNISERNNATAMGSGWSTLDSNAIIVAKPINDVAMTVLPNAPIDAATGLPVPTIAVATDGGVSVIKDDGTVVDYTSSDSFDRSVAVAFTKDNKIVVTQFYNSSSALGWMYVYDILSSNEAIVVNTKDDALSWFDTRNPLNFSQDGWLPNDATNVNGSVIRGVVGLPQKELAAFCFNAGFAKLAENRGGSSALSAYVRSDYNTGWMNGNIKLAALSDTDTTDVTFTELVTNGTFDTDLTGWDTSAGTVTWNSGTMHLTNTTQYGTEPAQNITGLTAGKKYILTFDVGYISGDGSWYIDGLQSTTSATGSFAYTVTPTTTNYTIRFKKRYAGTISIDNVSFSLAESDRSLNDNALKVFGTVTKNPVATGADLVAYSVNGTSHRYLAQPINDDLDFGTGDWSATMWAKTSGTSTRYLFSRFNQTAGIGFGAYINSSNGYLAYWFDNGPTTYTVSGNTSVRDGSWHCLTFVRRGGTIYIYIDGQLDASNNIGSSIDVTTDARLVILNYENGEYAWQGEMALFRISATAPSPEQIKKIYEDEKVLFQENAQATLYGDSDAVTALAYDDSTELLHVGTSAGRSVFQGLRRVDNTTTAVGAAISASNGLVADE